MKVKIEPNVCKSCELCIAICPKKVLKLSEEINDKGVHPAVCFNEDGCISCAFCAMTCPEIAIEVSKE